MCADDFGETFPFIWPDFIDTPLIYCNFHFRLNIFCIYQIDHLTMQIQWTLDKLRENWIKFEWFSVK